MLVVVPAIQLLNYLLGAWRQGVLIAQVAWLYNDLGGGDEPFVREIFLAVVFGLFNNGSLAVAIGPGYSGLSRQGLAWAMILGGVILTTMQVQDLKDQAGDKLRGRKSICLHVGEEFSRISIAVFVCLWSCVSGYSWGVSLLALSLIAIVAAVVMARVVLVRSPTADAKTWRLWCFWLSLLYALPVFGAL
ncbi:hypothetical protein QBC42DRAFT_276159 [Cladorrhinum samala]|uniref:Uncharacterized protein n=1 Tax=Cladorrhinum samala TaxID=585594 RepID=A0AAV9HDH8_9PEZI|nr:hypothetical protein QBC42DRAFT_276159 [Cladorrhinum samala]